jgi:NitT/TauT family transport system ATP-binding protein
VATGTEPETSITSPAAPMPGASIDVRDGSITFGGHQVMAGVDLHIADGEFVCLLGPSGCGKSTLLSAMAGFLPLSGGTVRCGEQEVRGHNSLAGMVFQQSDVLFDWMTVADNVTYGPRMGGASRAEVKTVADAYLTMIGWRHSARKYPSELSGGMRQRVQIARVLASQPQVLLMDEPFGALDAQTRAVMQNELVKIWATTGSTVVFVTHDIDEALALADRVVVMSAGPRAGIKSEYTINSPRPRHRNDPELLAVYERLHADIREEVAKTLRAQGIEEVSDEEMRQR